MPEYAPQRGKVSALVGVAFAGAAVLAVRARARRTAGADESSRTVKDRARFGDGAMVTDDAVRSVVDELLAGLPAEAVAVKDGVDSFGDKTIRLEPRASGAIDVTVFYSDTGLDVMVGQGPAIEITAPRNINYGPPELPWADDLRAIIEATAHGQVVLGYLDGEKLVSVDVLGTRLGANTAATTRLGVQSRRAAPWT